MALLGNICWFIFGGWLTFLLYTLAAIIFFPMFIPLFRLARYSAWPFGRTIVTQAELQKYRKISGAGHKTSITEQTFRITSGFLNIVWMFTFGWILALVHFVSAVINLAFFWMIFTIPNISGNWKLMSVALMPFNKVIVPSEIAKEIRIAISRNQLNI
ncbi:hypothetical protein G3I67_13100 [Orrella sp. NBD-18]|uniref:Inner membrane component domain-containing protein n=1 Tax=Sheuella amnicola TaxID=2707330 RepID=A0A6B2R066_9BURK|nr:hypothetical protein [Sheuella amnicola]